MSYEKNKYIASLSILSEDFSRVAYHENIMCDSLEEAKLQIKNYPIERFGRPVQKHDLGNQIHYVLGKYNDEGTKYSLYHAYLRADTIMSNEHTTYDTLKGMWINGQIDEERIDKMVELERIEKYQAEIIKSLPQDHPTPIDKKYIVEEVTFINGIKQPDDHTYEVEDGSGVIGARRLLALYREKKIASIKSNDFYEYINYGYSQNRCFIEYIDHTKKGNDTLVRVEYHIIIDIAGESRKKRLD